MGDSAELVQRLAAVRLVGLDVDGVLTERGVFYAGSQEMKRFDIQDGHGIVLAQRAGLVFAIVTGRESEANAHRARELGISEVHQGVRDKRSAMQSIAGRMGLEARQCLYMGDDIQDLSTMAWCGVGVAPADANAEVLARVALVTKAAGGRGAVRELVELLLKAQGTWKAVLDAFLR